MHSERPFKMHEIIYFSRKLEKTPGFTGKGSLTVWALYAYFSDSQNAAFELLVWCM